MNGQLNILIADDDQSHRTMLAKLLTQWGYAVKEAEDGLAAVSLCSSDGQNFDLVLMDMRMPRLDGMGALRKIRAQQPNLPILIMTAYSEVESAVEAVKAGAYDYLAKPLDFARLKVSLRNVFAQSELARENASLTRDLAQSLACKEQEDQNAGAHLASSHGIIGQSKAIERLWQMLRTVAPTEATVLITGESGTGKELAAKALHRQSLRQNGPFVAINCGALSEELLSSELFGHEKGAFTGADKRHDGLFIKAGGGTIFLDEIGELTHPMQVKLLRVLQEKELLSVGGSQPKAVDCRVIAATNRDLTEEVRLGRFREDLYYRLNVLCLTMPSLRERPEDIPILASFFAERFAARNHKQFSGFAESALGRLTRYSWPGNVRELENVMERAIILMPASHIGERELPERMFSKISHSATQNSFGGAEESASLANPAPDKGYAGVPENSFTPHFELSGNPSLEDVERAVILQTLARFNGNKSEAARILGITRKTLHSRLNRYLGREGQ